jgi:hypothetical protein
MAREVQIGPAATGKLRGFWAGFGLTIVTLGFYYYWWFYYVNRELKDIGVLTGDAELAQSRPGRSVLAVTLGAFLIIPPLCRSTATCTESSGRNGSSAYRRTSRSAPRSRSSSTSRARSC